MQTSKKQREAQATELYVEIRKEADSAVRAKQYARSRRLYLQGLQQMKEFRDTDNRICALHAGAANAARCQGKYAMALSDFASAIATLDNKTDGFTDMFRYIVEYLHDMATWIKLTRQKEAVQEMATKLLRRFSKYLNQPAPRARLKTYHLNEERIKDEFAALEESNPKTTDWLEKQALLARLKMLPMVVAFKRPKEFYQAAYAQTRGTPFKAGKYYFFTSVDKSSYRTIKRSTDLKKRGKTIFSARKVAKPGSWMTEFRVSNDGELLAYGLSESGSDFETWRVRDLKTGKDLADAIENVPSGSISFHPNRRAMIYRKCQQQDGHGKYSKAAEICVRQLKNLGAKKGEKKDAKKASKKADEILHEADSSWVDVSLLRNKEFLLLSQWPSSQLHNRMSIKQRSTGKIVNLFTGKNGYYQFLGEYKNRLFFKSDHKAPRGKIVALDFDYKRFRVKGIEEIFGQSSLTLQDIRLLADRFILQGIDQAGRARLWQCNLTGELLDEIELPFEGTIYSLSTDFKDKNIFFALENFATPKTVYRHHLKTSETELLYSPTFSIARRVVQKLVQVESKDGTMVPMNIAYLKGLKLNGKNPALLSVYGGFNIPCFPYFSYQTVTWLAMGGVWAQPYLRGGSELGATWHLQATKLHKQRTFDDTIASAEWLIENGLTSSRKLAIYGGSNGGLTVGAAITQRPDLFGAAIADNGLYDMLKYSLHGLGWAWQSEYGSTKNQAQFQALLAYSPYHQAAFNKNQKLPHVLVNASAGDNRVLPWHSYKFAAALEREGVDTLLNIKWDQGHGWGRPDWSVRDNLAYLQWALKINV